MRILNVNWINYGRTHTVGQTPATIDMEHPHSAKSAYAETIYREPRNRG